MIEMISIGNWGYLKSVLEKHHENYLATLDELDEEDFRTFVEKVFTRVIRWNSYELYSENELSLINFDDELALDLLEAISALNLTELQSDHYYVEVMYVKSLGALIVEWELKNDHLEAPLTPQEYASRLNDLRTNKLTIIARLLDELRLSKSRK